MSTPVHDGYKIAGYSSSFPLMLARGGKTRCKFGGCTFRWPELPFITNGDVSRFSKPYREFEPPDEGRQHQ